jgi:transcription-repair coupling factor (superfamily II helicase)
MKIATEAKKLIIPAVTPYFLDKGEDWCSENFLRILDARRRLRWWRAHTLMLEEGAELKPSAFVASLVALGYARADRAALPGEFSGGGAYWLVFPIGGRSVWQVEFLGDRIERLSARAELRKIEKFRLPKSEFGELSRLKPGDYVVHVDHGIGVFRGISGGEAQERFFVLEYAPPKDGRMPDTLRVPVELAKKKLTPYYGFERPKIHRLGSEAWLATRERVREDVLKIARDLLRFYAERHTAWRRPWMNHPELERPLAESFPYGETRDQERALRDIERDLASSQPMDRLLIGDVGFGKTEVALRTAWKAVTNGMQVALLAPTTILADQHRRTFQERLEPLGGRVAILSRLTPPREAAAVLAGIRNGTVDVVIGTHRILSADVSFKRLGLLIVDEEQRFGVLQKEKLKMLRATLDTLSLSATPIPRTLSMALAKLRPISLLRTPPAGRIGIKTFVLPYAERIIREAIGRELRRGGQVYFLHNRIETMRVRVEELRKLIPGRRIQLIHGRMAERDIMATMAAFREGRVDVLVATTIIENGLDLSNVNTLIVADSVRLGLGQAHQIRGRVGRGSEQAYAYFLYAPRHLTDIARERLQALEESAELGAGFDLAMKDLELRGAGNILGKQQSGAMNAVGLNLYMQMLAEAVETLQTERDATHVSFQI